MKQRAQSGRSTMLVLAILRESPLHGYGIAKALADKSHGVFSIGEGMLYPLLHELEQRGFVQSHLEQQGGRLRKIYALSPDGAGRLAQEEAAFEAETKAVRHILRLEPGGATP